MGRSLAYRHAKSRAGMLGGAVAITGKPLLIEFGFVLIATTKSDPNLGAMLSRFFADRP